MAWWIEQAAICPTCHTRYDDWDPARGGDRHAYYPEVYTCMGCRAAEDAYDAAASNARESKRDTHGVKVRLVPRGEKKPGLTSRYG